MIDVLAVLLVPNNEELGNSPKDVSTSLMCHRFKVFKKKAKTTIFKACIVFINIVRHVLFPRSLLTSSLPIFLRVILKVM